MLEVNNINPVYLIHLYSITMPLAPKPILKWVGGKTQLIDVLMPRFPLKIHNYYEPFVGGGSVLLALLSRVRSGDIVVSGTVYASDVNDSLIHLYRNIQMHDEELYAAIQIFVREYGGCPVGKPATRTPATREEAFRSKESYYYWIRGEYNRLSQEDRRTIAGSAMFLFLNKTCFRGLFRVGPNGFNVPYGNYANPEIVNREHLAEIRELIRDVVFECRGFETAISNVNEVDDFVYFDPPYVPEKETSFVGYTENGFHSGQHAALFAACHALTDKNQSWLMSNADVPFVREAFSERERYRVESILCRRSINSKHPEAKTREVIIQTKI